MKTETLVFSAWLIVAVLVLWPAAAWSQQSFPALVPPSNTLLVAGSDSLFLVSASEVSKIAFFDMSVTGTVTLPPWTSQSSGLSAAVLGDSLFVARGFQVLKINLDSLSIVGTTLVPDVYGQAVQQAPPPSPPAQGIIRQPEPVAPVTPTPLPIIRQPEPNLPTSSSLEVPWNK